VRFIFRSLLLLAVACMVQQTGLGAQGQSPAVDKSPHAIGFVTVKGFSTTEFVRLEYLDWGGAGDTVLLLAGGGNDAHIFDTFAPQFVDRWHVIGLTRRGFGASEKPALGYDTATRVADVRQFLDAIKISRVPIVGHSLAGDEMTLFASRYPDRVRKLAYLDAAQDRLDGAAQRLKDPFISPVEKRMWLESLGSPDAAEVVLPVAGTASGKPVWEASRRASIEHFRKQQPRGRIVEMKHTPHYMFLGPTQDKVVRLRREFLSQ
jgi:pimeloyl-ACP methyl ester carboxylesterase